jgi:hypothetical protein
MWIKTTIWKPLQRIWVLDIMEGLVLLGWFSKSKIRQFNPKPAVVPERWQTSDEWTENTQLMPILKEIKRIHIFQ